MKAKTELTQSILVDIFLQILFGYNKSHKKMILSLKLNLKFFNFDIVLFLFKLNLEIYCNMLFFHTYYLWRLCQYVTFRWCVPYCH